MGWDIVFIDCHCRIDLSMIDLLALQLCFSIILVVSCAHSVTVDALSCLLGDLSVASRYP